MERSRCHRPVRGSKRLFQSLHAGQPIGPDSRSPRTPSAAIYEVERGSSWTRIAACLGIRADEAEERYAPALQAWSSAFEEPYCAIAAQ
ncbi:hypothetical protein [Streptomyces sp. c-19]|uniref:hypothetical protein n=1 Tax=Streptomyces sp. c-19 TaxID=2789275 RepID=UPI00398060B2